MPTQITLEPMDLQRFNQCQLELLTILDNTYLGAATITYGYGIDDMGAIRVGWLFIDHYDDIVYFLGSTYAQAKEQAIQDARDVAAIDDQENDARAARQLIPVRYPDSLM